MIRPGGAYFSGPKEKLGLMGRKGGTWVPGSAPHRKRRRRETVKFN
jgi:hypothetical protein